MKKIRVLVVDDSFFMRKMITDLLQDSGVIEVIDTARNGVDAIEKVEEYAPDVITLDVEMPKMDGIEALRNIMKKHPVPVIMLSSLTKHGTDTTIKALDNGAFDFVAKPSGAISFDIDKVKNELVDKVLIAHKEKEKWIRMWNTKRNTIPTEPKPQSKLKVSLNNLEKPKASRKKGLDGIVAIGTSTGGPKALQEVITKLPDDFPYTVVIVQHMPAGFTKSLANRLNSLSKIQVEEATDGKVLESGVAYIAPGNYHMEINNKQQEFAIELNQKEPLAGHRPSVDILFRSLKNINTNKVYVIMTGMGSDGAKGVSEAKKDRDVLIAEHEQTCVVYGMPKAAVNSGLVDIITPLHDVTNHILDSVNKQRRWQSWK